LPTSAALDITAGAYGSSAAASTGNFNTTDTDIILAVMGVQAGGTITPNTGWTQIYEQESYSDMTINFMYRIGAAGTYNAGWTNSNTRWVCSAAAYKPAAGGGALSVNVSDAIVMTENISRNLNIVRLKISVSDAISISEFTKEPISPLVAKLNDAITVLENLKAVMNPTTKTAIDIITVLENAIVSLNTVRLNISVSDAISVSENVAAELAGLGNLTKLITDTISVVESIAVSLLTIKYYRTVNDAITVLENLTAQLIYVLYKITVFDSIAVTESVTALLSGGFSMMPYGIMSYELSDGFSSSVSFKGNVLPITITTNVPTGTPPNNKGVIFRVSGGAVTIYVWDGSSWIAK